MNRTVTVRARVEDRDALEAKLYAFTESFGFVVDLEDVYFQSTQGYLKLRTIAPSPCGQLIYYERLNKRQPFVTESRTTEVEDAAALRNTLASALGELAIIYKKRRTYTKDNIRINQDDIDELGDFVDISVSLKPNESPEAASKTLNEVMTALHLGKKQLVSVGYLDMLLNNNLEQDGLE